MDNHSVTEIADLARQQNVPVQYVPQEKLNHMSGNRNHQGVMAVLAQLDYIF